MKRLYYAILLVTLGCNKPVSERFEIQNFTGDYAYYYKNLTTGTVIAADESEKFHAASTMKIPVMMELYKQQSLGILNLSDSLLVLNSFKSIVDQSTYSMDVSEDSDDDVYAMIGKKKTYLDLIKPMIQSSSNLATNILIEKAGAKQTNAYMHELGAINMEVLRGVEDQKAYDLGLSNSTTAKDLAILLEKIENNSVPGSQEMKTILKGQKWNDLIPVHLPSDLEIAHKTGSITGVHNDAAIVYSKINGPYILVILSKNMESFEEGTKQLSRLSEAVYNYHISQ
ncbi:MAG: serine hydrolase [Flavobacteriaceae bacterium]